MGILSNTRDVPDVAFGNPLAKTIHWIVFARQSTTSTWVFALQTHNTTKTFFIQKDY